MDPALPAAASDPDLDPIAFALALDDQLLQEERACLSTSSCRDLGLVAHGPCLAPVRGPGITILLSGPRTHLAPRVVTGAGREPQSLEHWLGHCLIRGL
jgi:hypothetical protein